MIKFVEGIDLIKDVRDFDVILVGTSIMNKLGNGFQYKVGINFPDVLAAAKTATKYADQNKLGTVTVWDGKPAFALCYITKGRYRPDINPDALDYDALESALKLIAKTFKGKRIASTILGHSIYEGGGDKEKIIELFNKTLGDLDVTLYDYEQLDIDEEKRAEWSVVVSHVGDDFYLYYKKKYFWDWNFGSLNEMPDDIDLAGIKKMIAEKKKKI